MVEVKLTDICENCPFVEIETERLSEWDWEVGQTKAITISKCRYEDICNRVKNKILEDDLK